MKKRRGGKFLVHGIELSTVRSPSFITFLRDVSRMMAIAKFNSINYLSGRHS